MATTVKLGEGLEWTLMLKDERGLVLGVHFPRDRKISKAHMAILKAALLDAAEKMDNLPKPERHNAIKPAKGTTE